MTDVIHVFSRVASIAHGLTAEPVLATVPAFDATAVLVVSLPPVFPPVPLLAVPGVDASSPVFVVLHPPASASTVTRISSRFMASDCKR